MNEKLAPCPFCGGQPLIRGTGGTSYTIICRTCAAQGPWFKTLGNAQDGWNRRAPQAEALAAAAETASFLARWGPEGVVEEARFRKELEALLLAAERRGAERMRAEAVLLLAVGADRIDGGRRLKRVPQVVAHTADVLRGYGRKVLALPLTAAGEEEVTDA